MTLAEFILGAVTLQRIAELVLSRYNASKLLARGAIEIGSGHYPLIFALHAAWLISLWIFGRNQPVNLLALAGYLVLQALRGWVMWTLGARWTTRILVLLGEPLVASGPYRYLSHPNYAVVAGEIALLPLMLNLPLLGAIFTLLNAGVLALRIRVENRALAGASDTRPTGAT
jgi:methyltransferase